MATHYLTLKGTCKWAKVYQPDVFAGAENYKITFYPFNEAEWEKFEKADLQLKVKEDIDGRSITFRRPVKKVIKDDVVFFSPPEITGKVKVSYVNAEGEKVRQYEKKDKDKVRRVNGDGEEIKGDITFEENPEYIIPNGSTVLVNFSYYDTAKGKGHRLENITVLELLEFVPQPQEEDTEVKKDVEKVKVKSEDNKTISEDLNDKIPW